MATQQRNAWKIFGIVVIVAAIAVLAFVLGRGCERKKDQDRTTTTSTTAAPSAAPSSPGNGSASDQPATTPGTETVEDGAPTVVSVQDEIGPCVGGFQDVTHTTTYSDGTSASSIARQPCDGGVIEPVPGG